MKRWMMALILAAGLAAPAGAVRILTTDVPEKIDVGGQSLMLNGAGVRVATILKVKVYVASFYAPAPLVTPDEVMASKGPFRFDFVFQRAFDAKDVQDAWVWQFKESNEHFYPDFEKDKAAFVAGFGALKKFGVETVEMVGDETRVIDQGRQTAVIKGRDFQKAFLSLWFGGKSVMPTLKTAFLAGGAPK